jgi:hypothetical protein
MIEGAKPLMEPCHVAITTTTIARPSSLCRRDIAGFGGTPIVEKPGRGISGAAREDTMLYDRSVPTQGPPGAASSTAVHSVGNPKSLRASRLQQSKQAIRVGAQSARATADRQAEALAVSAPAGPSAAIARRALAIVHASLRLRSACGPHEPTVRRPRPTLHGPVTGLRSTRM